MSEEDEAVSIMEDAEEEQEEEEFEVEGEGQEEEISENVGQDEQLNLINNNSSKQINRKGTRKRKPKDTRIPYELEEMPELPPQGYEEDKKDEGKKLKNLMLGKMSVKWFQKIRMRKNNLLSFIHEHNNMHCILFSYQLKKSINIFVSLNLFSWLMKLEILLEK